MRWLGQCVVHHLIGRYVNSRYVRKIIFQDASVIVYLCV
uniref:Uncharacterized protein n=1 Tax=Vibrio vulnificus TaxID=672 RepID=A0A6S4PWJ0_VIBVL|nr:hypothetical protein [Vibrio vulnificus]